MSLNVDLCDPLSPRIPMGQYDHSHLGDEEIKHLIDGRARTGTKSLNHMLGPLPLAGKSAPFPRGLRPTAPGICAQAESAFPTLGAWRSPGRDSCLGHIFSSEASGWFWLCNYSSPSSLQTWPCAPQAQGSGICSMQRYFLLALESPCSPCPELGTTEVPLTLLATGPCSLGPG